MTGRDDMGMDAILESIRRIAAGDEEDSAGPDVSSGNGPAPPRPLSERGPGSLVLASAIFIPSLLLGLQLQALAIATFGIPAATTAGHEDGMFAAALLLAMVFPEARPARAAAWILMACAAFLSVTAAVVGWSIAAGLLFRVDPGTEIGLATAVLLGVAAILGGWAAFLLAHRLAGRHSPWRGPREGGSRA